MPKGGKKTFSWTKIRVAYVMAWKGNDVEAAREAGCGTPEKDAARLMGFPEIAAEIEKKRRAMFDISAKKIATKASKIDVVDRALKLADLEPSKTNNTINGQVAALKLVAEMQGFMVKGMEHEEFRKQLEGKSEEDKEYFARTGYWPGAEPSKPN